MVHLFPDAMTNTPSYKKIYLVACVFLLLIPFFVAGWTGRTSKLLPKGVTFQHNAAGLFTQKSTVWWDHHLEGIAGNGTRFEIAERDFFPMGAFGYRSRYDRILIESNRLSQVKELRFRLAEYVAKKWIASGRKDADLAQL